MKKLKIYITQMGHPAFRGGGNTVSNSLSESFVKRGHAVTSIYLAPKHLMSNMPRTLYGLIIEKASIIPIINCFKIAAIIKKLLNNEKEKPDAIISFGYEGFFIPSVKRESIFIAASHNFIRDIGIKDFFSWKWLNPLNGGKLLYLSSVLIDKLTKLKADFVQCLCRFGADRCETIYKLSSKKIFIIPNGVDMEKFAVRPTPKKKTILFIGGSAEHKGLDILIKALLFIVKKHPNAEVVVLGEMNKRKEMLVQMAEKIGVSSKIKWIGLVFQKEIFSFYREAYLVVLPSRLDLFPLTVLEAMAYGIPIVAANVGGIPEIINNKVNGIIINSEDSYGFAKSIIELLDNRKKAEEIGRNGRTTVEQKFTWEKVVEKYEKEIYSHLNHKS